METEFHSRSNSNSLTAATATFTAMLEEACGDAG